MPSQAWSYMMVMPRSSPSRTCGTILLGSPTRMPVAGSVTTVQPYSLWWLPAAASSAARCAAVSSPVTGALLRFWKLLIAAVSESSPLAGAERSPAQASAAWIFKRSAAGRAATGTGAGSVLAGSGAASIFGSTSLGPTGLGLTGLVAVLADFAGAGAAGFLAVLT